LPSIGATNLQNLSKTLDTESIPIEKIPEKECLPESGRKRTRSQVNLLSMKKKDLKPI
jgi:hypothetical protein